MREHRETIITYITILCMYFVNMQVREETVKIYYIMHHRLFTLFIIVGIFIQVELEVKSEIYYVKSQ